MPRPNLNLRHSNPAHDQRCKAHWSDGNTTVCARCECVFDAERVRTTHRYTVAAQLQDWTTARQEACRRIGEPVPELEKLSGRGQICSECAEELAKKKLILLPDAFQDGAYQTPEPDWRPKQRNGSAFDLCACGNLKNHLATKCSDCISDERHAQTRPGPKHIRKA